MNPGAVLEERREERGQLISPGVEGSVSMYRGAGWESGVLGRCGASAPHCLLLREASVGGLHWVRIGSQA